MKTSPSKTSSAALHTSVKLVRPMATIHTIRLTKIMCVCSCVHGRAPTFARRQTITHTSTGGGWKDGRIVLLRTITNGRSSRHSLTKGSSTKASRILSIAWSSPGHALELDQVLYNRTRLGIFNRMIPSLRLAYSALSPHFTKNSSRKGRSPKYNGEPYTCPYPWIPVVNARPHCR